MSIPSLPEPAPLARFFRACAAGDVHALRELLKIDASLVHERDAEGSTGLHQAVCYPDALRLLIQHGADPNVRDIGDNASPLHFAAAGGYLESVRILLDAGADVHGAGDAHKGEVIGWAAREGNDAVIDLLLERGARHHIFSAIALGRLDLVERLVEDNPECLSRRRSRFENGQTPLHAAFAPPDGLSGRPNYAMVELLIRLGADVEAKDDKGRTPMAVAMLRGDRDAMRLLKAAGAKEPQPAAPASFSTVGESVKKLAVLLSAPDLAATMVWYTSIGFRVIGSHPEHGDLDFLLLSLGAAEVAFQPGDPSTSRPRLWFEMVRIDDLYQLLKQRQLRVMQAVLGAETVEEPEVRFEEDLFEPFYGGRQFSILDNNGVTLIFYEPESD